MKWINLLLLVIILTCPIKHINSELQPYVNWHRSLLSNFCTENQYKHPNQIFMTISSMPGDYEGVCVYYGIGYLIIIDKGFWESSDPLRRQSTLSHELMHCEFLMNHSKNPYNYMYESEVYTTQKDLTEQILIDSYNHCQK